MNQLRFMIAPITVRFLDTEDLLVTLSVLERAIEIKKGDKAFVKRTAKAERLIARELIRRRVRFWAFDPSEE